MSAPKHFNRLTCMVNPGDYLVNRYKIVEKIGRGGFCDVWRVYDEKTGREYAAKLFRRGSLYQEHYDNELSVLKELSNIHPYPPTISKLYDYFSVMTFDDQKRRSSMHLCTVEELLGDPISSVLDHLKSGLPLSTVKQLMRELCVGLDFLHKNNIIHADVSLGNILLTKKIADIKDNNDIHVVLSDFNSSSRINDIFYARAGTREYKAPEVVLELGFNEKADIWSLGCCFYEILCDSYLFEFDSSSENNSCGSAECSDSECDCKYGGEEGKEEQQDPLESSPMSEVSNGHNDYNSRSGHNSCNSDESCDSHDSQTSWNEDYQHLIMMEQLLGKAPRTVYKGGNRRKYFDNRGNLVHNPTVVRTDLVKILVDDFEYSAEEAREVINFLLMMIQWEPSKRASAEELLNSDFLKSD